MTLTVDLVRRVLFLFNGGRMARLDECERLTRVLGSREEFVAWLLLESGLPGRGVTESLLRTANASVVLPSTRRTSDEQDHSSSISRARLEAVMKELLVLFEEKQERIRDFDLDLVGLLSLIEVEHHLGLQLVYGSDALVDFRQGS